MTTYHYPSPSLIGCVRFKQADNGSARAYIEATDIAKDGDFSNIARAVTEEGWYAIPAFCDGKPALEIRGYLREKSVLDLLSKNSWTQGVAKIEKEEKQQPSTMMDKIRARSLQGVSTAFIAADLGYMAYGHKEGRIEDVLAGFSYMLGSATMGLLGTHAQATAEIRNQTKKLLKYAKDHDFDLPKDLTVPIVTDNNKRDVFHKAIDTLQTFPSEIGNSFTGLAGSLIAYSSWKHRVAPSAVLEHGLSAKSIADIKYAGKMDIGLGLCTVMSGAIGALVKEKKRDPDEPRKQGIEGMWEWVRERPLSIAAFGYMCSTACHAMSTWKEYNNAKKTNNVKSLSAVPYRASFIACTIIGEILLSISSKGHGEGVKSDISTEDSVIAIAAEIIARQKPDVQPKLIQDIGTFLGRPDVLGEKDIDTVARLQKEVAAMQQNPWAQVIAKSEADKEAPKPYVKDTPQAWQQKTAISQAIPPQLGA